MIDISLNKILTGKQKQCWRSLRKRNVNFVMYGGAAGGGKSFVGCLWVLFNALQYDGTRWLIGRSVLKRLKETTLVTFFDICKMLDYTAFKYNSIDSVIKLHNESEILLKDLFAYPSDPNFESLGSLEITGAFIDECSQITQKAKDIVQSRIRYKLDKYNLTPKMLGTCNPAKNWTYQEIYKPFKEGNLPSNKLFIQAFVTDNPHLPKSYAESLANMNDKVTVQRLLNGFWEYDANPYSLIEYDAICDLFTNQIEGGSMYITCDVARFGEDLTVICVWSGLACVHIEAHQSTSVTDTSKAIRNLQKQHKVRNSNTIVDEDGVGGGVKDTLNCRGFVNNARAFNANYQNIKTECYFKLADLVNEGAISLVSSEHNEKIIEELEQVQEVNADKERKRQILSKDALKQLLGRSPDFSDALMMRMYWEVGGNKKAVVQRMSVPRTRRIKR